MPLWTNKVALVTGATSGLGLHIATAFAAAGAAVVLAARDSARLDAASAAIATAGSRILAVAADVTNQEHVDRLIERAIAQFDRIDALVNCVGVSSRGMAIDTTPAEFTRLLDINLLAAVRCTRAAMPHLLSSRGHLVNIGSLSGKTASRYLGAYPASKFAPTAYTQQLRFELGPEGLHVLLVSPGPIARDDSGVRYADQTADLPASARKPGGGVKLKGIDPGSLRGKSSDVANAAARSLSCPGVPACYSALQQLSPRLGDWILRRMT